MAAEENKVIARRFFEEILSRTNLSATEEIVSPEFIGYFPVGLIDGLDGVMNFVMMSSYAFPDLEYVPQDMVAEEDKVVVRWSAHGTHRGVFEGIAPTGKRISWTGISILRIADGKVVEDRASADLLGVLEQLGAVPAPATASR